MPVVPSNANRLSPWEYERSLYKRRNERLIRRFKAFRCIFTCFDKFDVIFTAFICFALSDRSDNGWMTRCFFSIQTPATAE